MAGYIEDRWLKKRPDKTTGKRERTSIWGKGKRYRVKGIPGIQDRSFDTSEDAKRWLAEAQTDSSRGDFVDPRNGAILLADYIADHWWPSRTDEPSTAGPMRSRIWNHLIPLLGSYPLHEIDASALRRFKADLLSRVEESSAEIIWIHLTTILNAAVDDKRLLKSPVAAHRSIKRPKPVGKKAKAWSRTTVDAVRDGLQERYQIAVDLGLALGVRQGEALGLAEEDFDFGRMWSTYGASSAGTGKDGPTSAYPRAARPVMFPFRRTSRAAFGSTSSASHRSSAPCRGVTLRCRRPSWKSVSASRSPCDSC